VYIFTRIWLHTDSRPLSLVPLICFYRRRSKSRKGASHAPVPAVSYEQVPSETAPSDPLLLTVKQDPCYEGGTGLDNGMPFLYTVA